MAEQNQHPEEEGLQAPEKLVEALNHLQKERIFVPPPLDRAVLRGAREHLRRLERPQSGWKPRLSWAAMAACLALGAWLGQRFMNPPPGGSFDRADINSDGRVDILDAFVLAGKIRTGGTLDPRWDINGDGRVDRADVNAIAARAVSLAQAGPEQKRSAALSPYRESDAMFGCFVVRAFPEPQVPRGFGLRQSSGAFRSGLGLQKRQRTAAVQDAIATAHPLPRFMVPMRDFEITEALYEPAHPLTPSLSPSEGEGVQRTGEGDLQRFMVPAPAQKRNEPLPEPTKLPPGFGLRQSSGAFRTGFAVQKRQRTAAVQDAIATAHPPPRFMVPTHAKHGVEAFHEPAHALTPSLSPTGGEGVQRTGEGDLKRFMVPMPAQNSENREDVS